ncbi:hypothetical protein SDC9_58658 [bioreactor metagenome]|uniref:DUF2326 domain-containing protein n=1 Tax=bioreactor metagenome TaxID=1076179 RepID=A0A644X800_9ZZZZ
MSKLVFHKLFLFSTSEKLARCITFNDGINIVSSSQVNGTDRGKSVIMRSLYHTLGADCQFDDIWDDKNKTYILKFSIDSVEYFIYRCNRLFKFFDSEKSLLFTTVDRSELAANLKTYFNFAVELPDRTNEKLEITPAAYNYILSFIDQDYYSGTQFSSFSNLAQYANYKENVLYYHFGAFDKLYFELEKNLEMLKTQQNDLNQRMQFTDGLFSKTVDAIHGSTYTANMDLLRIEVEKAKDEYAEIVDKLSSYKSKLISLRNQKYELESTLSELKEALRNNEGDIAQLNEHICPFCKSVIVDTMELRAEKYNSTDDIVLMSNDIQQNILDITGKISAIETRYREMLGVMTAYDEKLKINTAQIDDVLKHRGYMEIRDSLLAEMGEIKQLLEGIQLQIKEVMKKQTEYEAKKKEINDEYYKLLLADKTAFGLSEIDDKRFVNIKNNFKASGSNKPIATVIWYMSLTKLKNKFNPSAIRFPLVFDSPNNAEMDDEKKREVLSYLIRNATDKNQMIISAIGFSPADFESTVGITAIPLTNEKYHLLCAEDFELYKQLLLEFCNS